MTNRTERYVFARGATARRARAAWLQPVLVVGALLPGVTSGQERGAVTVDVTECVELTSPAERLACFEAGVDEVLGERAPVAAPGPQGEAATSREPAAERGAAAPRAESAAAPRTAPAAARAEPATEASRAEPAPARAEVAAPSRSAPRDDAPGAPRDEIVGVIKELRETVPNAYLITLTDGQVWRQNRPAPYPLTEGASVRIYKVERWGGSYRLTAVGRKGFIQVEPIR